MNEALKSAGRGSSAGVHQRMRGAFVVSEVALTLVLLAGAGLMLESFVRLRSADPGFNAHGVLTMRIALSDRQYALPERQTAFFDETLRRVNELPGVLHAGASDELPTSTDIHGAGLWRTDRPEPKQTDVSIVLVGSVTPDYFRALQLPLIRGRYFSGSDRKGAPLVAVVDAWAAKHFWPDSDPTGKFLKLGRKQPARRIVGIVGEVEQSVVVKLVKGRLGQVYLPFAQEPKLAMSLALRTTNDSTALVSLVQKTIREIDVDQPVFQIRDLESARAAGATPQRLATTLLGGFAAVALLLAMIGIYGVVAYSARRRTREIGIRMALGAERSDLLKLLLRQGMALTLIGIAIGLAGALALTRAMSSLLYGVGASDPRMFVGVCLLLSASALLASYIPARRAAKIDPVVALRQE